MSSNLFNSLGAGRLPGRMGNMQAMIQQFQQFRQGYRGDARQQVQQMLNSGQITQDQYNRAAQIANQLQGMLGKF